MGHIIHLYSTAILHEQEKLDEEDKGGGGKEKEKGRQQREEEQKWKHAGHMDVFKDHQGREARAFSHKP